MISLRLDLNQDGALFDSRFDGGGPFRDTPEAGGISLESALHDFGPSALDDLIPRLRALARTLDAAHQAGAVHGALHPSRVIITDDATTLISGDGSAAPFVAPEVADGDAPTPAANQFALAAIAYQWLFGRPVTRSIGVRSMPGVDRGALTKAFTRALSPEPSNRFASCAAFCDAVAEAAVPELPLLALDDRAAAPALQAPEVIFGQLNLAELPPIADPGSRIPDPIPAIAATFTPPPAQPQRFGAVALILATMVGAVVGFAAGYMARPRALQTNAPQAFATAPGTEREVAPAVTVPEAPAPAAPAPAPKSQAPRAAGRLPVRSTPSRVGQPSTGSVMVESRPVGAAILLNGRPSGNTPRTIGELPPGSYRIVLTMPGFRNFTTTVRVVAGERVRAAASLTAQEQE